MSRKLGEMGYRRSAKKCKEKFENVHKYYKRSKEGRAGRQDGKSYRFFSQLEALHSTTVTANSVFPASGSTTSMNTSAAAPLNTGFSNQPQPVAAAARFPNPQQVSAPTPIATAPPPHLPPMPMLVHELTNVGAAAAAAGISFSSNTSSDASESDDDDEATEEGPNSGKKRKVEWSGGGGGMRMMAFFEGMMRQVMERQEAMQQRFLEAIERQEQDRAIREESWRRQEMARIASEHEVAAGERATAVARNAAVLSFLEKVTGQTVLIPPQTTTAAAAPASVPSTVSIIQTPLPQAQPPAEQPQQLTPPPSQRQQQPPPPSPPQQQNTEMLCQQYHQPQQQTPPSPPMHPSSSELVPISSPQDGGATVSVSLDPASSRWPKPEVHALIKLRSGLDSRYQESGPKGPLWEEISAGMQRLGYHRSAKRCKEKWENINKYFKKVKERNKKRPEDAKTCPYFHQLDALYRSKVLGGGGSEVPALTQGHDSTHLNPNPHPISVMPQLSQQQQQQLNQEETDIKKGNGGIPDTGAGGPSDGGMPTALYSDNSSNGDGNGNNNASGNLEKPEDNVKELMGQPNDDYGRADGADSDNMEEDEDDEDDDDEDGGKSQYMIQFQRPNVGRGNGSGSSAASAPSSRGKAAAAGSFLAMVT